MAAEASLAMAAMSCACEQQSKGERKGRQRGKLGSGARELARSCVCAHPVLKPDTGARRGVGETSGCDRVQLGGARLGSGAAERDSGTQLAKP